MMDPTLIQAALIFTAAAALSIGAIVIAKRIERRNRQREFKIKYLSDTHSGQGFGP